MKKTLTVILAFVLVVVISVTGTFAYLTSSDSVTNTFTVGKVAITLDEAKVDANGKAITGDGAARVEENSYKLLPGQEYDKDPTVTVLEGSEESYIRMLVTIDKKAALDAIGFEMSEVFTGTDAKWVFKGQTAVDDTMTYEFRYADKVAAPSADVVLPALFTKINVPGAITNAQLDTLANLKINVVAQAIQAAGFGTADAAWAAFEG